MRAPSSTDFTVAVENIGDFIFSQRQMRDELKIQSEFRRMTEGLDDPGSALSLVATWLSVLKVLMVRAPSAQWQDLDTLDPLDPDVYAGLLRIYEALRDKERSFRRKPDQAGATDGAGTGAVASVPVSAEVQPTAD